MNLIAGTVLLFIILSPGVVFRLSYLSAPFSRRHLNVNFIYDITWSIIPGLFIQFLGIYLVGIYDYAVNFEHIGYLLFPPSNTPETIKNVFLNLEKNRTLIIGYYLFVLLLGAGLGFLLKFFVRICKLDRKFRLFRFSNKWHYIFHGEVLDFPHIPDTFEQVNRTYIDLLCQIGSEQYIYIGEFFDYYYDEKGDLDSIHLRIPIRRKLELNTDGIFQQISEYYDIPSRFIIIPYKTILNINVRYFHLDASNNTTTGS